MAFRSGRKRSEKRHTVFPQNSWFCFLRYGHRHTVLNILYWTFLFHRTNPKYLNGRWAKQCKEGGFQNNCSALTLVYSVIFIMKETANVRWRSKVRGISPLWVGKEVWKFWNALNLGIFQCLFVCKFITFWLWYFKYPEAETCVNQLAYFKMQLILQKSLNCLNKSVFLSLFSTPENF
jgi:hypothetical protein